MSDCDDISRLGRSVFIWQFGKVGNSPLFLLSFLRSSFLFCSFSPRNGNKKRRCSRAVCNLQKKKTWPRCNEVEVGRQALIPVVFDTNRQDLMIG